MHAGSRIAVLLLQYQDLHVLLLMFGVHAAYQSVLMGQCTMRD